VWGIAEKDAEFGVDRLDLGDDGILVRTRSVLMQHARCVPYQRMQFSGTKGRIEIEIPFKPARSANADIY